MVFFSIDKLQIAIGKKIVVKEASMKLNQGELVVISGENGSGKTSLVLGIIGDPRFKIVKGKIKFRNKDITHLAPDEKFKIGIFVGMQLPVEIPGLRYESFLWNAYKKLYPNKDYEEFKKLLDKYMKVVGLNASFMDRELHKNFSGGEKKKSELLQYFIFSPKLALLDEIDSGLDIKTTKRVVKELKNKREKENATLIVISHNPSFIRSLGADKILIMENGVLKEKNRK